VKFLEKTVPVTVKISVLAADFCSLPTP